MHMHKKCFFLFGFLRLHIVSCREQLMAVGHLDSLYIDLGVQRKGQIFYSTK